MSRNAANATVLLALLLAGLVVANAQSRDNTLNQDLLKLLAEKAWRDEASQGRWEVPRAAAEFADVQEPLAYHDDEQNYVDNEIRTESEKRSAVATALNAGRRRRQPAPALGKAVTPFVGVGVLNDVRSYIDTLRENVEAIASLSPEERVNFFPEPPNVVHAPVSGGGGGGMKHKIYSLRPVKPYGSIRSYNRRSYPSANEHDPRPLWIGLGR